MRRSRFENVGRALELRGEGMDIKQIAAEMGVNFKTVYEWLEDPAGAKSNARKRAAERRAIDARRCENCGGPVGSAHSTLCRACHMKPFRDRRAEILALRADGLTNTEIEQRLGLSFNVASNVICRERARGVVVNRAPYWERGKERGAMNQAARKSLDRDRERTVAQIAEREQEIAQLRAYLSGIEAAISAFEAAMGSVNGHAGDLVEA